MAIKGLNVRVALCTEVSIILVLSFDIRFQVKKAISYIILFFPERAYISHNNSMDITNYISIATVFSLEIFVYFYFTPFTLLSISYTQFTTAASPPSDTW